MTFREMWRWGLTLGWTVLLGAEICQADAGQLSLRWQVGDQWTVETASLQTQARARSKPIRWRFTVQRIEKLQGRDCYRVVIRPSDPAAKGPVTVLWVDRVHKTLRQVQAQLPTAAGYRTMTESYASGSGQASPVVGPLTALPIDLPLFTDQGIKNLGPYRYETTSGPVGTKAIGDVGFSIEIRQEFMRPDDAGVKSLLGEDVLKSLSERPLIEVHLDTPSYQTRQLWQPGQPWPTFADNGTTQSRLVEVNRAAAQQDEPQDRPSPELQPLEAPAGTDGVKTLPSASGHEQGRAETIPWSGYWWPIHEGLLLRPLAQYDRLTGLAAAAWERKHHPPNPETPHWHGYCHAWAAGSVMEPEPGSIRTFRLGRVELGIGDAASHARGIAGLTDSLKSPPEGILVLASCAPGQVSWENEDFEHGVFMHYVLEGLSGKVDSEEGGNRNRRVSLFELYEYCNVNTKRFVRLSRNDLQTPMLWGKIRGNFDLGVLGPTELPEDFTNSLGMKLKLIPAGEFMMGSPADEEGRDDDETQHRVRITKPYYLGLHEVTQGQWEELIGSRPWGRRDVCEVQPVSCGFVCKLG